VAVTVDDMPEFKPSNMSDRIKRALAARGRTHFSRADWDFQNASWTLDGAIYKTSAPSLHGTGSGLALVLNASSGALSDGRLVGWMRSDAASLLPLLFFRNQRADGGADVNNSYYIQLQATSVLLRKYVGGGASTIDTHNMTWTWSVDTWYKIRVTWWTSVDRMYVRVEYWDGDSWKTLGGDADTDFEDVNDLWKDNAVNRVGVYYMTSKWIDDFEAWG